ncbi:uncharacterized protein LOC121265084 [Juglans microcarpa x Juglans regia]|uniref:uncharacterized protein LOC121265084 n=1 Tax=Juglans microcarpa x Juglans regia TaxID=2249226 RepID=UPI001B7DD863|nr:uncharacterized protein LOC121265084 [Juglans microcarpa x Juglans regia]
MAFDPGDSSHNQVAHESSYSMLTAWQCDFYAGYGYDVIEEDALNEKSCIQVLRMLKTRADTEIDELEQDLVLLQSELACAEHEEWSELCCNALREKINCLDISLRSLRNTDESDTEVQLLMHVEPAERVHEIVRALLRNYFPENNEQVVCYFHAEQPLHAIALDSSSNVTEHAAYLLDENEMFSIIDSNISVEETKESSIAETCTGSNLSLKLQEKKTNDPEIIKPENTKAKDSNVDSLRLAAGHHNGKQMLEKNDVRSSQKGEAKEHSSTPNNTASQDLFLKPERKRKYNPEMIKPADTKMKNSCKDALPLVIGQSNKKILGDSDLKTTSEEIEEHNSTQTVRDFILGSSSKLEGNRTDHGKEVKRAKTIGKGSSSDAIRNAAGCSPGKFELNVGGNLEVREDNSNAMHKIKILNSSSNPESKGGNLPKTAKTANAIGKSSSTEALRLATGLNRRKKGFGSESGAFRQAESAKSDLQLKLSEFAVKIARRECIKGLKNAPTDKIESPDSSLRTECERKTPQGVTVQEAGFIKTGDPSTSLLDLKDQRGQETTKLQLMERNSLEGDVPKAEAASDGKKSIFNLSLKLPKQKEKRKIGSDTPQVQERAFPAIGVLSNSPIARFKSKQKFGVSTSDHSLNVEAAKRIGRRGQYKAKENSVAPVDCKSSVLVSQRNGKRTSRLPITVKIKDSTHVNMDLLNLPDNATDNGSKENLQIIKPYSDDSHTKALVPLPYKVQNLKDLTLIDLRAIAKENKLTKYHKLRKHVLLELLADRLGCC